MVIPDANTLAKAHILLNCVNNELELGTRHFNAAGRLLITNKEVIQTLLDEGVVTLEPRPDRQEYFQEICRKYATVSM